MKIEVSDLVDAINKLPKDKKIQEYRIPVFEHASIYKRIHPMADLDQAKCCELKFERNAYGVWELHL